MKITNVQKKTRMKIMVLMMFVFTFNWVFTQNKREVILSDSFNGKVDLTTFKTIKRKNIHSRNELKRTSVFEYANFFCGEKRLSALFDQLPKRIRVKYVMLANNTRKASKRSYLHCFIYQNGNRFFENFKELAMHSDCFQFFKANSTFYFVGKMKGFESSSVYLEVPK
jgi:hypothetical protein